MKKECTGCLKKKKLDRFHKQKSGLYGYKSKCKVCRYNETLTKEAVCEALYWSQVSSSKHRGHKPPNYTKIELQVWLLAKKKFHKLYKKWVESDYNRYSKPSCDRVDNSKGYSFENIELMTWFENDTKVGNNDAKKKIVHQYDLYDNFIQSFASVKEAGVFTGIPVNGISNCALGNSDTSCGFKWKYADKKERICN